MKRNTDILLGISLVLSICLLLTPRPGLSQTECPQTDNTDYSHMTGIGENTRPDHAYAAGTCSYLFEEGGDNCRGGGYEGVILRGGQWRSFQFADSVLGSYPLSTLVIPPIYTNHNEGRGPDIDVPFALPSAGNGFFQIDLIQQCLENNPLADNAQLCLPGLNRADLLDAGNILGAVYVRYPPHLPFPKSISFDIRGTYTYTDIPNAGRPSDVSIGLKVVDGNREGQSEQLSLGTCEGDFQFIPFSGTLEDCYSNPGSCYFAYLGRNGERINLFPVFRACGYEHKEIALDPRMDAGQLKFAIYLATTPDYYTSAGDIRSATNNNSPCQVAHANSNNSSNEECSVSCSDYYRRECENISRDYLAWCRQRPTWRTPQGCDDAYRIALEECARGDHNVRGRYDVCGAIREQCEKMCSDHNCTVACREYYDNCNADFNGSGPCFERCEVNQIDDDDLEKCTDAFLPSATLSIDNIQFGQYGPGELDFSLECVRYEVERGESVTCRINNPGRVNRWFFRIGAGPQAPLEFESGPEWTYTPAGPGLYTIDAYGMAGQRYVAKTSNSAKIWVRPALHYSLNAARLSPGKAIIFLGDECLGMGADELEINRRPLGGGQAVTVGRISAEDMRAYGFFDAGVPPDIQVSYSITPIRGQTRLVGSNWVETTLYHDNLGAVRWDHLPQPGLPTRFSILLTGTGNVPIRVMSAEDLNQERISPIDAIERPVRVTSPQERHQEGTIPVGFSKGPAPPSQASSQDSGVFHVPRPPGPGVYPTEFYRSVEFPITDTRRQINPNLVEGYLTVINEGTCDLETNICRELPDYSGLSTSFRIWVLSGDLAKTNFTYQQILIAVSNMEEDAANFELGQCAFTLDGFRCAKGSPVMAMEIALPLIPPPLFSAYTKFFIDRDEAVDGEVTVSPSARGLSVHGETAGSGVLLSPAWRRWVDQSSAIIFPNSAVNLNLADINTENTREVKKFAYALATDRTILTILKERAAQFNISGTGSSLYLDWHPAFDALFFNALIMPICDFSSDDRCMVDDVNSEILWNSAFDLLIGLERSYDAIHGIRNERIENLIAYTNVILSFVQMPPLMATGGAQNRTMRPWPGEDPNACSEGGLCSEEELARRPRCEEGDFPYYRKKFTGYEFEGRHVNGYNEFFSLLNSANGVLRLNAWDRVGDFADYLLTTGGLRFKNLPRDVGGQAPLSNTLEDIKIYLPIEYCIWMNFSPVVYGHELSHGVHDKEIFIPNLGKVEAAKRNNANEFYYLMGKYLIFTEFRAYRMTLCIFRESQNLPECRDPKLFMHKVFFVDEAYKHYRRLWYSHEMCFPQLEGFTATTGMCRDVDDLLWKPWKADGTLICDPFDDSECLPDEIEPLP